jgi:lipoprotein signal peptidase
LADTLVMHASPQAEPGHDLTPRERPAFRHLSSHLRLWMAAGIGLWADLYSKAWAFDRFDPHETYPIIKNLCSFQLSLNPGALFGIGTGLAPVFVGASALALMFVLYLFANSPTGRWTLHVALGLVLAGAVGNLYDRTTQSAYVAEFPNRGRDIGRLVEQTDSHVTIGDFPTGARPRTYPRPSGDRSSVQPVVRDFLKIEARLGRFQLWPWIFNVADALLVIGVSVLLLHYWADHRRAARSGAHAAPWPTSSEP